MKTLCLVGAASLLLLGAGVPFARACIIDAECDDGDVCNGLETCVAGVCQSGTALGCDDGNACRIDPCDSLLGCQYAAVPDGTGCGDGDVCNGDETCLVGICTAGGVPNCDDGNICTNDICDPVAGCQNTAVPDGLPCGDGDVCNGLETCQGGQCTGGTALSCDDGNPCTTDTCDSLLACQHTPATDGTSCSDGNLCNGTETCLGGVGGGSSLLDCNDNNPCTADTCDPLLGCQHAPVVDGTACNDGDACNGTETCQGGTCTAGTALNCNDNNTCTTDTCDAAAGCQHAAAPNRSEERRVGEEWRSRW